MEKLYTNLKSTTLLTLSILCAILSLFTAPVRAQTQTVVFDTAGLGQKFVVPAGVTAIWVKAWGAGGGAYCCGTPYPDIGGGGGFASAIVTVTPGETLTINIGGGGNTAGGLNGGGAGTYGAGGGGSTDLLRDTNYILIAGGGGGAGNGTGGSGGGLSGTAATVCDVASQGGSQTGGGLLEDCGQGSSDGSYHQGGWGHEGGGGGGYYGGGGGSCGCGGGGGSGFMSPTGTTCTSLVTAPSGNYGFIGGLPPDTVDLDYNGTAGRGHISTGTIQSGNGSPGELVIKYNYPAVDVPRLVGNDTVCPGFVNTYTTDALMNNYKWGVTGGAVIVGHGSSNDATIDIQWNSSGTVSVKYMDGCTGTQSTTTTFNVTTFRPSEIITANPSGTICAGTAVTFTATPTDAGNNPAYQWLQNGVHVGTDSGATFTTSALSDGDTITGVVISVVAGVYCNSQVSNPIVIHVGNGGTGGTITANPDSVCTGNSAVLTATGGSGNIKWQSSTTGSNFTLINGANSSTYNTPALSQTTYYRFISGSGNCVDTSPVFTLRVTPLPAPPVLTTTDSVICSPDSARISATGSYATYHWSNGDTRSYTYATASGQYWVTVTTANNCSAVSGKQGISVNPPPATPLISATDSAICSYDSTAIIVGGTYARYQWNNGDSTGTIRVSVAGNYWVTVTDANHCSAVSGKQGISVYPLTTPPVVSTNDSVFCTNDSTLLTATAGYSAYLWNNAETGSQIYVNAAGNYYVTVTDANGCTAGSNHLAVSVYTVPSVSIIQHGDTLSSYGAVAYQWILNNQALSGDTVAVFVAHQAGSYALQITDTNGCTTVSNPVIISGIQDLTEESISIYPNPTVGSWQLAVGNSLVGGALEVFDEQGRLVMKDEVRTTKYEITASSLPSGVYYLRISNDKVSVVRKLVKL